MKNRTLRGRPDRRPFAAIVVVALGLCVSTSVEAQAVALDRFRAPETTEDLFATSRATGSGHLRFGAQLHVDYGWKPLVYERVTGDPRSEALAVVRHQLMGTLGLSLGLFDRVVAYAGLPGAFVLEGSRDSVLNTFGVAQAEGPGLGDVYLGARVRLLGSEATAYGLALQGTLTLPSSGVPNESHYRGDSTVTGHPELLFELRPGWELTLVANVGARLRRPSASLQSNLQFGHEVTYALGVMRPVWKDATHRGTRLLATAQAFGDTTIGSTELRTAVGIEAILGARFEHRSGFAAGAAGGVGLTRGFGTPWLRMIGTLGWAKPRGEAESPRDQDEDGVLDPEDRCPTEKEDVDSFEDSDGCPDPDNDGDAILDVDDRCPLEPETNNGWQDEDGCADAIPDQDGDGLRDPNDGCPLEAEDADGFEDGDGCPDPDNDADQVLDAADRCPIEAGSVDNRGCPDSDRDGDTVVDRLDNCPDEPGAPERQGCAKRQQVVLRGDRLEILGRVYFKTSKADIQKRSYPLLDDVARVLNAHPEIEQIVVEGHTDSRGSREGNLALSQARADEVVLFLVRRGMVDEKRLSARGYGPDRPVVPNATKRKEHERNRRVEFRLPSGTEGVHEAAPDRGTEESRR